MKFWLATANVKRIEACLAYGIFSGAITNPHVVAQEKQNPIRLFKDICSVTNKAYYQLRAADATTMLQEAETFLAIDPEKIRIKVPATLEGFQVISKLTGQGLRVMATAVPTNTWLLYAAAAGAKEIAPYSGLLQKQNIMLKAEGVKQMQQIIQAQALDVSICTGIYHAAEIAHFAEMGVQSCFIWEKDVETFMTQDLVGKAVSSFDGDWDAIDTY